ADLPLRPVEAQLGVVARHAGLEDGDAALFDLPADACVLVELVWTTPNIDKRSGRRRVQPRQDLLLADLDRACKLVAALLTEHTYLGRPRGTYRTPHARIVTLF